MEDLATMPCYRCAKRDCQLAGNVPEDPVMPCSECRGANSLVLKRRPEANFYLRCKGYPQCKGTARLPKCAKDVSLSPNDPCARCGAKKLIFKFDRNKVPPGTPLTMSECPNFSHCASNSVDFRSILEMENLLFAPQAAPVPANHVPPRGPSAAAPVFAHQQQHMPGRGILPRGPVAVPPQPGRGALPQPARGSVPQPGRGAIALPGRGIIALPAIGVPAQPGRGVVPQPGRAVAPARGPAIQAQPPSAYQPPPVASSFQPARSASVPPRPPLPQQGHAQGPRSCRKCGLALQERVSHSSNNPGRAFFKCEPCNSFEWADQAQDPGPSGQFPRQAPAAPRPSFTPSSCYHCGATDHFPVACPTLQHNHHQQQARGAGRGGDVCFKCNQPGHWSSQCPSSSGHAPAAQAAGSRARGSRGGGGAVQQRRQPKQRSCTSCSELLPPRKRVCDNCGTKWESGTGSRRRGNGAAETAEEEDDLDDILD
jgi:hypothetical protein